MVRALAGFVNSYKTLTPQSLAGECQALCRIAPEFRALLNQNGLPPLWARTQSLDTLVHIVLEQKVSIDSARAVMQRVRRLCQSMQAHDFMNVDAARLRQAGVSQRKADYCLSIAAALASGELRLAQLRRLPDDEVVDALCSVRGVGPWTAGVYLTMAMRRADAWASGDRALAVSAAESFSLPDVPDYPALDAMALRWRPHRATAARMLWHGYLRRRDRH